MEVVPIPEVVPTLETWHERGIIDLNDLESLGDRLVAAYCEGVRAGQRFDPSNPATKPKEGDEDFPMPGSRAALGLPCELDPCICDHECPAESDTKGELDV